MQGVSENIRARLGDLLEAGQADAHRVTLEERRRAQSVGRFGSTDMFRRMEEALLASYTKSLQDAGRLISSMAGPGAADYAGQLDDMAADLAGAILVEARAVNPGARYDLGEKVEALVSRLEPRLEQARRAVVGDFRFGTIGGERMSQSGSVQNTVTIQDVSNSIVTVVQTGHAGERFKALGLQLVEVLKSEEVQSLTPDQREEVTDLAGHFRDELAKPSPDEGRLRRGLGRLSRAFSDFGRSVASGTLSKMAAEYLMGGLGSAS